VGFFAYKKTKKTEYLILAIFVSFAIDADHLIDYWIAYGFNLNFLRFIKLDFFKINNKVFVPLHSWEIILTIFITPLIFKFKKNLKWIFYTIALAMFFHMLWDSYSYCIKIIDYSLIWRATHNFKVICN
jgi:hypothetical protein